MEIYFADSDLEACAKDERLCVKKMGQRQAAIFYKRLNQMHNAQTLEDVRHLPGRYHELKEDRKGQWACDLEHPNRLIFEPMEKPIPTSESGTYIWLDIKSVDIIEITNYHGK
jgi:proteic killer suppression protein